VLRSVVRVELRPVGRPASLVALSDCAEVTQGALLQALPRFGLSGE
jgi:hypothetical protein